jgi:hypothetical protein
MRKEHWNIFWCFASSVCNCLVQLVFGKKNPKEHHDMYDSSQHDKYERVLHLEFFYDNVGSHVQPQRNPGLIQAFIETHRQTEDSATHSHTPGSTLIS